MPDQPEDILAVLDKCCGVFNFPMLDNGYVYLAATRLSLYRSPDDWALVIEVFGFSPRAGLPDTSVQTFASRLHDRDPVEKYASNEAHERYLANNPNNEFRSIFPVHEGGWLDEESLDLVAVGAKDVGVRDSVVLLPSIDAYEQHGIVLEEPPRVHVFELCRYLAAINREKVLATSQERRASVPPELEQILQLEEWDHPDLVKDERPSRSETFQQLAEVLTTGDVSRYRPSLPPNTHWRNWPDGGQL